MNGVHPLYMKKMCTQICSEFRQPSARLALSLHFSYYLFSSPPKGGSLNLLYSFYHFLYSSWLFHLNRNCWLKLDFSKPERPIILSQYIHVMSFVIGSMFSSLNCCICSNFSCFTSILVKININDKILDLDGVYTCWICLLMYFCR